MAIASCRYSFTFLLFMLPAISISTAAVAQTPIGTDAVTPRYSEANLSPDGRYLAIAIPQDGGDRVAVIDLETEGAQPVAYPLERGIVQEIYWRGNDAIVIPVYGRYTIYPTPLSVAYLAYPTTRERPIQITYRHTARDAGVTTTSTWSFSSLSDVVDLTPQEEDFFYMAGMVRRSPTGWYTFATSPAEIWARDLLRVDAETGVSTLAMLGNEDTAQWFTDGAGDVLARVDLLPSGAQVIRTPDGGERFTDLTTIDGLGANGGQILGLSHDASALIVRSTRGADIALVPVHLATGTMGEPLFNGPNYLGSIIDKSNLRVVGVRYAEGLLAKVRYFDSESEFAPAQATIEAALTRHSIHIIAASADRRKMLFQAHAPSRPPVLAIFDASVPSISTVAEQQPEIAQTVLGEVRAHPYDSASGAPIGGLLILPPGRDASSLPLVILDDTRTDLEFDLFGHFLASHGFAVLRPGVRQVRSFGELTGAEELEEWVAAYQASVIGGLNSVVAAGIADPERVCIIGTGENGYAALMTTVHHSDAFTCAVGVNGMYDLRRAVIWARSASVIPVNSFYIPLLRNHDRFLQADLESFSPVNYGDEISASVLVIGDDRDGGTSAMVAALDRAGKDVEYVELVDNLFEPANARFANIHTEYAAIQAFLSEQIGP